MTSAEDKRDNKKRSSKALKEEFRITEVMQEKINYVDKCLLVDFANSLNDLGDEDTMKKDKWSGYP